MEKIKELRNQLGMSQKEFADYFGFNLRTLQNWESGRVKPAEYVYDMLERRINEGLVYTDLKETKDKTKTYEYRDGFLVDIVDSGDEVSAYLYHKNYGVKDLMFGLMKKDVESEEELKEMITNNLTNQSFIENYTEEYMNGKECGETVMDIYNRTIRNCKYYESIHDDISLINEIGVLRGIYYCLQTVGVAPEDEVVSRFFETQEKLKKQLSLIGAYHNGEYAGFTTRTYAYAPDSEFMFDVVANENHDYMIYLWNWKCGVKSMVGNLTHKVDSDVTFEQFEAVVEHIREEVLTEDVLEEYKTKYMSDEKLAENLSKVEINSVNTDLHTYVVASNMDPTCIVVAHSKDEAVEMVQKQAEKDLPTEYVDNIMDWEAYEVNSYFSTDYEPTVFGWVKGELSEYLTFT